MSFSWIPFYEELADKLLEYKNDRVTLISKVKAAFKEIGHNLPSIETDNNNIEDIDPFTVFALFNFGKLGNDARSERCKAYKDVFAMKSDVPTDFDGIPLHNYSNFRFYLFKKRRKDDSCFNTLWSFFDVSLKFAESDLYKDEFELLFDEVKNLPRIATTKLSVALFHIRPSIYYPCDINFHSVLNDDIKNGSDYIKKLKDIPQLLKQNNVDSIAELSLLAYDSKTKNKNNSNIADDNDWYPNDTEKDENMSTYDKNLILYGPPGTGKTYNSVIYAVAICDNRSYEDVKSDDYYNVVLPRYRELVKDGRIAFTTFHQSYGYEDFIEGIKPYITDSGNVGYYVKDGVFKDFCESFETENIGFEEAWKKLIDKCAENEDFSYMFTRKKSKKAFKAIMYDENSLRVYWNGEGNSYNSLTKKRIYDQWMNGLDDTVVHARSNGTIWANRAREAVIDTLVADFGLSKRTDSSNGASVKNRVFIIDEINRGNISKIFGELITLIEPTKRIGAREEMKAVLPYSGDEFGVPENVYIIGTMNTADRSIALMDTALRRRFKFVEMQPDTKLLDFEIEGVKIKSLLDKINERIELLYDREHTIGHSFFLPLKGKNDISVLSDVFEKDIIPLLQEYFYDDYERISLVLGNNAFVEEIKVSDSVFNNASFEIQKKYRINTNALSDPEEYKRIYIN